MPLSGLASSAQDGFQGDRLDLAEAAQRHVRFHYADDLVHGVVDDCPDLRIDLEFVLVIADPGYGLRAGGGWLAAGQDVLCTGWRPSDRLGDLPQRRLADDL